MTRRTPLRRASRVPGIAASMIALGVAGFASGVHADAVTDWNTIAINATHLTAGFGGGSFAQTRTLAHTHAAIFDAVNAIERKYQPYLFDEVAPSGASAEAAVAGAAYTVLVAESPGQKAMLDRALAAALAKVPDGPARGDGMALGKRAADKLLADRLNDGTADTSVFQIPPAGPGVWQQTPQFTTPIGYAWRNVQPMAIKDLRRYDLGGPPKLDSERFVRDYNEIKAVGARNSTTRNAEQTAVAVYWTVQTMIPWNRAAQAASNARNLSLIDNARLFALLNIAAHDTQPLVIEQKYRYNFWRPYTAIRYGSPAHPKTTTDGNWEPLLNTPGFPDYPSGHCTTSGGALGVLLALFPDDKVAVTDTHIPGSGLVRSWSSFTQMAKEVEDARVWGGIHFRTADEDGTKMGRALGADVVKTVLQPLSVASK